jgi:hypothetical protein
LLAIGLVHKYAEEDMGHIRDVVVTKMNSEFCKGAMESNQESQEDVKALEEQIGILRSQLAREKR